MKPLRLLIPAALAGLVILPLAAQRTTRPGLHAIPAEQGAAPSASAPAPVLAPGPEVFKITGYDKPLRSRRETFFASNHSDRAVRRIAVTVTYLDADRKMLHRRQISVPCDIPAGETRNLSIQSWDKQQSFYFVRSTVPSRTDQATPYDVTISVDTIFVAK